MLGDSDEVLAHWNSVIGSRRGQVAAKLLNVPAAIRRVVAGGTDATAVNLRGSWTVVSEVERDTIPTILEFLNDEEKCVGISAVCCRGTPDTSFVSPDNEYYEEKHIIVDVFGVDGATLPWKVEVRYAFRVDDSLTAVECHQCHRIDQRCKCTADQRELHWRAAVIKACAEAAQQRCVRDTGDYLVTPSVILVPCRDDHAEQSGHAPTALDLEEDPMTR